MNKKLREFILKYYISFLRYDFVISLFTECSFNIVEIKNNKILFKTKKDEEYHKVVDDIFYEGKIVSDEDGNLFYVANRSSSIFVESLFPKGKYTLPLINNQNQSLIINPDDGIPNVSKTINTTYKKLLLNTFITIDPFRYSDDYLVEYKNENNIKLSSILDEYKDLLFEKKIHKSVVDRLFNNLDYLQAYCNIFIPSISKKMLTVNPEIKKELTNFLTEHKDKLNDPITIVELENKLIELDKKYLKGDESELLLKDRTFNVHRKLMFIMYGVLENFGEMNPDKSFNIIFSNLDNGMQKKELPKLFNEVRRGFYKRSIETALGGTSTKEIVRLLQDTEIVEDDCGTKRGLKILITEKNKDKFIYRYTLQNQKTILLTKNNIDNFVGKTIKIRSPQFCESKNGYCYKCGDYIWELKKTKLLNIVPVSISSSIMMGSMKAMHGTKVTSYSLDDIDKFLV